MTKIQVVAAIPKRSGQEIRVEIVREPRHPPFIRLRTYETNRDGAVRIVGDGVPPRLGRQVAAAFSKAVDDLGTEAARGQANDLHPRH